jgi:hypothetical protein
MLAALGCSAEEMSILLTPDDRPKLIDHRVFERRFGPTSVPELLCIRPTFQDGLRGGRSDSLIRVDKSSTLGALSYEVVETKLARMPLKQAFEQLIRTLRSTIANRNVLIRRSQRHKKCVRRQARWRCSIN